MASAPNDQEATANLEAALYSAGRPLSMEELVRASGTSSKARTQALLADLSRKTKRMLHAVEITRLPDGSYVWQLKSQYADIARRFASGPLLPRATLKTLSYIACMQPVGSKTLVETRGTGVYAHIRELLQMDFIEYQKAGRIKTYTTTERFGKYFGLQDNTKDIKHLLYAKMKK